MSAKPRRCKRLRGKSMCYKDESHSNDSRLPYLSYPRMNAAERRNLSADQEEIYAIHFPEYHEEDQKYFVKVITNNGTFYYPLKFAAQTFVGNKEKKLMSYIDFLNENYKAYCMTNHLWSSIQNELYINPVHIVPVRSLCHVLNNELPLHHQYAIISGYCHDKILINDINTAPIYEVAMVDPESNTFRKLTKEDVAKPSGLLPHSILNPLCVRDSNNNNNSWSVVQAHYFQRKSKSNVENAVYSGKIIALKSEFKQTLFCLGSKIYGTMNMKMYKRETSLTRYERMSHNVHEKIGFNILKQICQQWRKQGSYTLYLGVEYKKLAALIGLDYLQKDVGDKKFYITTIDMKHNADNLMLGCEYWLVYNDKNGIPHTKAQAAVSKIKKKRKK